MLFSLIVNFQSSVKYSHLYELLKIVFLAHHRKSDKTYKTRFSSQFWKLS